MEINKKKWKQTNIFVYITVRVFILINKSLPLKFTFGYMPFKEKIKKKN